MDALLTVVVISLLMVLVYGPWQALCTARARQAMFERRDAIFDIAAGGRLDFDSESYRVLRKSLEGQIRYAHILTIPRFFFLSRCLRGEKKQSTFDKRGRSEDKRC
jgi:hypothetical protein